MNPELMSHANEAQDRRIEKLTASIEKLVELSNRDTESISAWPESPKRANIVLKTWKADAGNRTRGAYWPVHV